MTDLRAENVVSLDAARKKRVVVEPVNLLVTQSIETDLDLCGANIDFFVGIESDENLFDASLTFIFANLSGPCITPVGKFSLTVAQWRELKALGDAKLAEHARAVDELMGG